MSIHLHRILSIDRCHFDKRYPHASLTVLALIEQGAQRYYPLLRPMYPRASPPPLSISRSLLEILLPSLLLALSTHSLRDRSSDALNRADWGVLQGSRTVKLCCWLHETLSLPPPQRGCLAISVVSAGPHHLARCSSSLVRAAGLRASFIGLECFRKRAA